MKIIEKQHLVKVEGDIEVKKFGLLFNSKMVQLLSDSLYSDKILAIVRELSTNAYDSHVENNNQDVPFEVHLPTWNNPFFSIRDFGTGMSPERIDLVYRYYGGSDRTESNDFVGGMGLGSKSPFCYNTKSFTIDSWWNDKHYCYSAYIGEDGIPCIAQLSETYSDEPTGVCITVPVSKDDNNGFYDAARKIYAYFPIKPNFTGFNIVPECPEYVLTSVSGFWKLRTVPRQQRYDKSNANIIMGNVRYPINIDKVEKNDSDDSLSNMPVDIFVDIGFLSVDIGRENLSYDNRTKVRIKNLFKKISSELHSKLESDIQSCPNLWEARKKFLQIKTNSFVTFYNGRNIKYNDSYLFDNLNNTVDLGDLIKEKHIEVLKIVQDTYRMSYEKTKITNIHPNNNIVFYENDLTNGSFVRAAHISRNNESQSVILVKFLTPESKSLVLNRLGFDESYIKKISSVPSPTKRSSSKSKNKTSKVLIFRHKSRQTFMPSYYWENEKTCNLDTLEGLYLEFNRFSCKNQRGGLFHPSDISRIIDNCQTCGIKTFPIIYGIKSVDIKKIKDNKKLVNFFDYVKNLVELKLVNINLKEERFFLEQIKKVCKTSYYPKTKVRLDYKSLKNVAKCCATTNELTKFVEMYDICKTKTKNEEILTYLESLTTTLGIDVPDTKFSKIFLDKMEDDVYNKYVMLGMLNPSHSHNASSLAVYVDLLFKSLGEKNEVSR